MPFLWKENNRPRIISHDEYYYFYNKPDSFGAILKAHIADSAGGNGHAQSLPN